MIGVYDATNEESSKTGQPNNLCLIHFLKGISIISGDFGFETMITNIQANNQFLIGD